MTPLAKARLRAFIAQKGRCYYCGAPMWLNSLTSFCTEFELPASVAARLQCTAEHLVAKQDGGRDDGSNIVAACLHCNRLRHAFRPTTAPTAQKYAKRVAARIASGRWHLAPVKRLLASATSNR